MKYMTQFLILTDQSYQCHKQKVNNGKVNKGLVLLQPGCYTETIRYLKMTKEILRHLKRETKIVNGNKVSYSLPDMKYAGLRFMHFTIQETYSVYLKKCNRNGYLLRKHLKHLNPQYTSYCVFQNTRKKSREDHNTSSRISSPICKGCACQAWGQRY